MIDLKKICFIYCTNDEDEVQESLTYVSNLRIPDGYEVEVISVREAVSMAAGYNEAMRKSNAKYKVYVHQDVRIINANFISDCLDLFQKHSNLGLLGVIGAEHLPDHAVWWKAEQKYGAVYDNNKGRMELTAFQEVQGDFKNVACVDGVLIMTQYDLPWREDLFQGWHFYDLSQCAEFIKAGYEIGVPRQEEPWILHDCGSVDVKKGFEFYRQVFIQEYRPIEMEGNDVEQAFSQKNNHYYDEKAENYYRLANPNLLKRVDPHSSRVLDIGCGEGSLGAAIKEMYGIEVYGFEYFPPAAKKAEKKLDYVFCGDIESDDLPFKDQLFDQIIFGDVLEHLRDPWNVLKKVKPYLAPGGSILTSIPNVGHITVIASLLSQRWTYMDAGLLDKTHIRFFTLQEMIRMFEETGYEVIKADSVPLVNDELAKLIAELDHVRKNFNLGSHQFTTEAMSYQYIIQAVIK